MKPSNKILKPHGGRLTRGDWLLPVELERRERERQQRPAPRHGRAPREASNARSRGSRRGRTSTPSRGDPDDDPHDELTGRAAELAEELQAASDARIESWRAERIARAKHEQLKLEGSE